MIDIRFVRENPEAVRESQRRRGNDESTVDTLLAADDARRTALQAFENARASQKEISRSIGKASPEERPAILAKAKELGADRVVNGKKEDLAEAAKAFQALSLAYEVLKAAEERRSWKG